MDGYSSAFIFKFFLGEAFGISPESITEVIGLQPREVQEDTFTFTKDDVVVDLPCPKVCKLWFDHHSSNEPKEKRENEFFKKTPSCASLLIDIAKEKGIEISEELEEFKKAIDIVDDARYTKEDILSCYYPIEYDSLSMLQKVHVISAMFSTKDFQLNQITFQELLKTKAPTPATGDVWKFNPQLYHRARVANLSEWREQVLEYLQYDESAKAVIQDERKGNARGSTDHFFPFIKYEDALYNLFIRPTDYLTIVRIGSNIFKKELRNVDIGALCQEVGRKFGAGAGGGHPGVGGASIHEENTDAAIEFILEKLKDN